MSVRPATKRLLRHLVEQLPEDSPVVIIDDWHAALAELGITADTARLAIRQLVAAAAIHHADRITSGRPRRGRPRRRVLVINTANELVLEQLIGRPADYDAIHACTNEPGCHGCVEPRREGAAR